MKIDNKYLQRLGVLPYERPNNRRSDREAWFAPAGFHRGTHLTTLGVNPITVDPENQPVVWGQHTLEQNEGEDLVAESDRQLDALVAGGELERTDDITVVEPVDRSALDRLRAWIGSIEI